MLAVLRHGTTSASRHTNGRKLYDDSAEALWQQAANTRTGTAR
jgi:hypothetical protein